MWNHSKRLEERLWFDLLNPSQMWSWTCCHYGCKCECVSRCFQMFTASCCSLSCLEKQAGIQTTAWPYRRSAEFWNLRWDDVMTDNSLIKTDEQLQAWLFCCCFCCCCLCSCACESTSWYRERSLLHIYQHTLVLYVFLPREKLFIVSYLYSPLLPSLLLSLINF